MDNIAPYFYQKFIDCGNILNVQHDRLVSLKYRSIRYHIDYIDILDNLRKIKGMVINDLGIKLNGHAYLITCYNQSIVLVEHETGLEILYIASSIASIIGLVIQISSMVSNHRMKTQSFKEPFEDVELRFFNNKGEFIKEQKHNYFPIEMSIPPSDNNAEIELIKKKIASLEKKVDKLLKVKTKNNNK